MRIQTLQYFIAIADLKSYTKAAKQLYISQPALSKAISQLEEELACSLFKKEARKLSLTPKGKLLYDSAKKIIQEYEELQIKLNQTVEVNERLKIGYIILGHLQFLFNFLSDSQNIELNTIYDSTVNIKEKLQKREIDIALLPVACEKNLMGMDQHYLIRSKLHVLVSKSHSLYKKEKIMFKDLKHIAIIGWDKKDLPMIAQAQEQAFIKKGIQPKIVGRAKKLGDLIVMMNQKHAVGLCVPFTSSLPEAEFKTLPIEDSEEDFGLCLVWRKDNDNPALKKFLQYCIDEN